MKKFEGNCQAVLPAEAYNCNCAFAKRGGNGNNGVFFHVDIVSNFKKFCQGICPKPEKLLFAFLLLTAARKGVRMKAQKYVFKKGEKDVTNFESKGNF